MAMILTVNREDKAMKKFLIIAAAAALALTACQKVNKMDENLQDGFQEGFTGMEVRVPVSMDEGIQTKSFSYLDYEHRNDTQGYDWSPSFFNNDGTSTLVGLYSLNGRWYGKDYYLNNTAANPSYLSKEGDKYELVMNLSQPIDGGDGYSHFIVGFNAQSISAGSNYYSFASGSSGSLRFNLTDSYTQTAASAAHLDGIEPIYAVGSVKCADGTSGQDFKFHHVASLFRIHVKNTGVVPLTVSRVSVYDSYTFLFDRYSTVSFTDDATTASVPEPTIETTQQSSVTYLTVHCSDPENTGWNVIAPGKIATFYALAFCRTDRDLHDKDFYVYVNDQTDNRVADTRISGSAIAEGSGSNTFLPGYAYNFSVKAVGKSFEVDGLNYSIKSDGSVAVAPAKNKYQQENISVPSEVTYNGVTYSVSEIESSAFSQAPNLKSVTVAEGVTDIGAYAFRKCPLLEEIVLPSTIEYIDYLNEVFSPNVSIRFSATNPNFHVDASGVLYGSDKRLYFMPSTLTGDYTIEDGTKRLASHSILDPHFTSLTFPGSILNWSGYVFCFSTEPEASYRLILNWTAEQFVNFYCNSSPKSFYFAQTIYPYGTYFDRFILDVPEGMVDTYKERDVFKDTSYDSTGARHFTWATH